MYLGGSTNTHTHQTWLVWLCLTGLCRGQLSPPRNCGKGLFTHGMVDDAKAFHSETLPRSTRFFCCTWPGSCGLLRSDHATVIYSDYAPNNSHDHGFIDCSLDSLFPWLTNLFLQSSPQDGFNLDAERWKESRVFPILASGVVFSPSILSQNAQDINKSHIYI